MLKKSTLQWPLLRELPPWSGVHYDQICSDIVDMLSVQLAAFSFFPFDCVNFHTMSTSLPFTCLLCISVVFIPAPDFSSLRELEEHEELQTTDRSRFLERSGSKFGETIIAWGADDSDLPPFWGSGSEH